MMIKNYFFQLITILLLLKVSYLLLGIGLSKFDAIAVEYGFSANSYMELAIRKDAGWYRKIAQEGYPQGTVQADGSRLLDLSQGQSSWAFFPAYPKSNALLSDTMSLRYEQAAFFTSIVFSILALLGCFLFFKQYWEEESKAFFGTLVVFLFPFHFYFSMFLTEAPFFACLIWAFYGIQKRNLWLTSMLLVFLLLLRPNGLILLLPIYLFYLEQNKIAYLDFYKSKTAWTGILMCVPAVLAFAAYLVYQHEMTGHYFAFSMAQQGWEKKLTFPLLALFRRGSVNYQVTSMYVLLTGIFLAFNYRRLPLSLNVLCWLSILLPLTLGVTYGIIRYISIVFPVFIVVTELLYPLKNKGVILLGLYILHLASFCLWIVDHPLGF